MSQAWKDLERRKCRDMGGHRRHTVGPEGWAKGSDDDGTLWCYLETKYVTRYGLRRTWVEKARREAKAERRPWVIAIDEHNDRHSGIAVTSWSTLVELAYAAGLIDPRRARLDKAIGPHAPDVDPDRHVQGVIGMLEEHGL